jgi:hypothetical protein
MMEEIKKQCKCGCKQEGTEYFCSTCLHNFNAEDSFHKWLDGYLCPLCHPKKEVFGTSPVKNACWKVDELN